MRKFPFSHVGAMRIALALSLALALGACSDDDDTPAAPDAATLGQQLAAEQTSEAALSLINEMLTQSSDWAQGTFGTAAKQLPGPPESQRTQSEAIWDAEQQAWTWNATANYTEGANTVAIGADYWVQFRDGAVPQQYPDTATDEMEAHVAWDWSAHVEEDGSVADLDVVYQSEMVVGGVHSPTRTFVGEGSMTGTAAGANAAEETFEVAVDGSWGVDLSVPADGGCPTGTATVQNGVWRLNATYDGGPTVAWELRSGARVHASGTQSLPCGALTAAGAQEQSLLALDAVNDMLGSIPDWLQSAPGTPAKQAPSRALEMSAMAGCELGAPQGTTPQFSADATAWTWSWNLGCENQNNWFTMASSLWLQYRNGEVPQAQPEGATALEIRQAMQVAGYSESDGAIDAAAVEGSMQLIASAVDESMYTVTGTGTLAGHASHLGTDPQYSAQLEVSWQVDLAVATAGACPNGSVVAWLGDYTLTATYDGGAVVHWTLMQDDNQVGQGTALLNCAN